MSTKLSAKPCVLLKFEIDEGMKEGVSEVRGGEEQQDAGASAANPRRDVRILGVLAFREGERGAETDEACDYEHEETSIRYHISRKKSCRVWIR